MFIKCSIIFVYIYIFHLKFPLVLCIIYNSYEKQNVKYLKHQIQEGMSLSTLTKRGKDTIEKVEKLYRRLFKIKPSEVVSHDSGLLLLIV